ncbi:thioesterase family protein [Ferrovibrio sp.]|uniref:acyl-CoA thioesterase n=1 Tax=Ferrovibrio sp. TaxID=1917215 RepID=UPI00311DF315
MTDRYIETLRLMTQAWQCDHLGHVNVSFYAGWLGDAAFAIGALHGMTRERVEAEQIGTAAVRMEIDYQAELRGGDMVRMESTVESIAERKIVFRHRLIRIGDEKLAMSARLTGVCIDLVQRRSRAFPADFVARIADTFGISPEPPRKVAA